MDRKTARSIADGLTWARIFSVAPITIAAWYKLEWWVFGAYIAAALTDLLDGWFARRGTPLEKDTDLDGNADVVFSIMTLVWIWMLVPGFFGKYGLPYLPILFVIEVYLINARLRWTERPVPHFQFGRFAMALFCFLLPVLIAFGDVPWFVHTVFVIGTLSKLQLAWHIRRVSKPAATERAEA